MHFKKSILLPVVFIGLWALVQCFFARPESIVNDWMGWRQTDTQTIARNFLHNGGNILYPQINWGGNGPGYVESEFQLYPFLIATVMRFTGEAEWPGQLLNIIFFILTAFFIFRELSFRFGIIPAFFSAAVFLTNRSTVFLSTSVQPDSLCFMLYCFGLIYFFRFLESQGHKELFISIFFSALAALVKPTSLHIGIIQFLLVLFISPRLFRKGYLWAAWFFILAIVTIYLFHAHTLYTNYGNTFGIGIGGDSKFPSLRSLINPILYLKLIYMTIVWGIGPLAAIAGVYLIYKRKINSIEWACIIGNIVLLVCAMRVTTSRADGPHYHVFTSFLGAWLCAHAASDLMEHEYTALKNKIIIFVLIFFIVTQYIFNVNMRGNKLQQGWTPQAIIDTGQKLREFIHPEEFIIVRSMFLSRAEEFWGGGINNYEDPRLFYMTRTRGWVIGSDIKGIDLINEYVNRGANYYVETGKRLNNPELYDWLHIKSRLVFDTDSGRIYCFK
jgi:hypothetical protein